MATYKTLTPSWFVDLGLVPANTIVEYGGEPGSNLEPVCDAAKKAVAQATKKRVADASAAKPSASDKAMATALAAAQTEIQELHRLIGLLTADVETLKANQAKPAKPVAPAAP